MSRTPPKVNLPAPLFSPPEAFLIPDRRLEGLMDAMFRPGLGEGFQFNLLRVSLQTSILRLDGSHFIEAQKHVTLSGKRRQGFIVHVANRNGDDSVFLRRADDE